MGQGGRRRGDAGPGAAPPVRRGRPTRLVRGRIGLADRLGGAKSAVSGVPGGLMFGGRDADASAPEVAPRNAPASRGPDPGPMRRAPSLAPARYRGRAPAPETPSCRRFPVAAPLPAGRFGAGQSAPADNMPTPCRYHVDKGRRSGRVGPPGAPARRGLRPVPARPAPPCRGISPPPASRRAPRRVPHWWSAPHRRAARGKPRACGRTASTPWPRAPPSPPCARPAWPRPAPAG